MPALNYQAVVLAGGDDKRLYPLTSNTVKALLPVANKPLLSYCLRSVAAAGLKQCLVVVSGEKPAASISSWVQHEYNSPGGLQCEVVAVPEEYGTADALRAIASKITSQTFVVTSGDLLTDVPINALVATHQLNSAVATILLAQRKTSPCAETKPGKPPKNVDYIGLNPSREHLLFYASSPDSLRDLKVPLGIIRKYGNITINSDLVDAHLYVFNRSVLNVLASKPQLSSLRQDLLPYLTQQQFKLKALTTGQGMGMSQGQGEDAAGAGDAEAEPLPGSQYMDMSHTSLGPSQESSLRVHLVRQENYCARVSDMQSYGEVNKEVADSSIALHLSGLKPSRYDNIVPASTTIGNKTTVATACIVGEACVLGDKSSIKRAVLGSNCKLGVNVKVINSVIMDNVVIGDGCHIQNSIISSGAQVQERSTLKDCQIGPGFVVTGGVEYKGEVLAKAKA